jgi:hypothetical protein
MGSVKALKSFETEESHKRFFLIGTRPNTFPIFPDVFDMGLLHVDCKSYLFYMGCVSDCKGTHLKEKSLILIIFEELLSQLNQSANLQDYIKLKNVLEDLSIFQRHKLEVLKERVLW